VGRCAEAAGVARWRWGAGVGRVRPMRGRAGKGGGALGCRGVGWGAPAGAAAHGGFVGPPPGCCCAEDESDLDDFEEGDDLGGEPACCLPHLLPCTAASSLPCGFTPRGQPAALVVGWARRAGGGRRRCCRRPARQLRPTLCEVAAYRRADVARPLNRPFPAAQTTWRSGNTRSSRRGRTRRRGRRGGAPPSPLSRRQSWHGGLLGCSTSTGRHREWCTASGSACPWGDSGGGAACSLLGGIVVLSMGSENPSAPQHTAAQPLLTCSVATRACNLCKPPKDRETQQIALPLSEHLAATAQCGLNDLHPGGCLLTTAGRAARAWRVRAACCRMQGTSLQVPPQVDQPSLCWPAAWRAWAKARCSRQQRGSCPAACTWTRT